MLKGNKPNDLKKVLKKVTAEDFTKGPKSLTGDDDEEIEKKKEMSEKNDDKSKKEVDINEMKWESDVPEIKEQHDLGKPFFNKTPYHPEIHFIDSGDFEGHTRSRLKKEDVPSIDIHTVKKGNGRKCLAPEWASVNYRAYDKNEIEGDKARADELISWGTKTFSLGNY